MIQEMRPMRTRRGAGLVAFVALAATWLSAAGGRAGADEPTGLFSDWSQATFERARRERRIIVLTVSTGWCHWCHVMKRETYGDPAVRRVLSRRFLPVLVDADARPDLAERFRNYRWPATAFLTPDAKPVLALRGYRGPRPFLGILADVERRVRAGGPFPGFEQPSAVGGATVPADEAGLRALRIRLRAELDGHYDERAAGWGRPQKYPVPEPVAYGLFLTRVHPDLPGTRRALGRSLRTLAATRALIDPVFGGVYQYSLEGVWDRWHPEKIMTVNAGALTTYADAHAVTGDARWLGDADAVVRWLTSFMTAPHGAFYASQDADAPGLAGERYYRLSRQARLRYGVPRVDRSIYARENALAIQGLCRLHAARDKPGAPAAALAAARALLRTHRAADGSFHHAAAAGPRYLVDQAEMGRALIDLHQLTGETAWLDAARRVADALQARLVAPDGGWYDATDDDPAAVGVFARRLRSLEPNAAAARFLLSLYGITQEASFRERAVRAVTAVGTPGAIDGHWRHVAGLLIAVETALAPFAHVKVVGTPTDAAGRVLAAEARRLALAHPLVTWQRAPADSDGQPMALVCSDQTCSDPVRRAADLGAVVRRLRDTDAER
jgi:hypothetical protein